MLFACVFLAQKMEEVGYSHDDFCRAVKKDPIKLKLVENEQILIQKLSFTLHVHTPISSI